MEYLTCCECAIFCAVTAFVCICLVLTPSLSQQTQQRLLHRQKQYDTYHYQEFRKKLLSQTLAKFYNKPVTRNFYTSELDI